MKTNYLALIMIIGVVLSGCDASTTTLNHGFSLPMGDVDAGELVYEELQCADCHRLAGSKPTGSTPSLTIPLDPKAKIYSYEFLVTSIINPSHRLAEGFADGDISQEGRSKMRNYNDVLTVSELVDLVEFMRVNLHVKAPQATVYPDLSIPIMRDPY